MASVQSNPGFVTGQVPTAAQWNAAWTAKQSALIDTATISGPTTVVSASVKFTCQTDGGSFIVTVPPTLGQPGQENRVEFVKKSLIANANQVQFSTDGTVGNIFAYLINENDGGGAGWAFIDMDGIKITSVMGVP